MGKLSKAKKLTDTEKYCIEGMFYNEMEPDDIAKALGRESEVIEEYVSEIKEQENKEAEEESSKSMVLNETVNGESGVAIMTPEGSIRVDENRERNDKMKISNRSTRAIHSIHNE